MVHVWLLTSLMYFQNVLGSEGMGFKIAMGAFDKTRPPVCNDGSESFHINIDRESYRSTTNSMVVV